ncbi:12740_t:CDS:2, partial [Gigaspora rosea]
VPPNEGFPNDWIKREGNGINSSDNVVQTIKGEGSPNEGFSNEGSSNKGSPVESYSTRPCYYFQHYASSTGDLEVNIMEIKKTLSIKISKSLYQRLQAEIGKGHISSFAESTFNEKLTEKEG